MKTSLATICLIYLSTAQLLSQKLDSSELHGKYFYQPDPGIIPTVFAKGIVSTEKGVYANVTFHPGLRQACWTPNSSDTTYRNGIIITSLHDGNWSHPEEINFMGYEYGHRSPFYDFNGTRLYFQAYLLSDQGWDQKEKFYYVEQTESGWSKPNLLDTIFNKYSVHWQFSLDKNGNLYFGGNLRGVENTGGIYFAKYLDGKYLEPVPIFKDVEISDYVFGPAISPKNDYILFTRVHPRGYNNPRIFSIYVSFLEEGNVWSKPIELGEKLNMDSNQPRISPDGEFIFFVGNDGMSYWISSSIINELKIKH